MAKEADFQTRFTHYLKHVYKGTAAFELKKTDTPSFAYSAVEDHQIAALSAAKHGVLAWKIPDAGYQNPFDCFSLAGVPAFVVVYFSRSRRAYAIDIDEFILSRETSPRKSLTENEAAAIAEFTL